MLAVLAYCRKDVPQAINLLSWMEELDGLQTKHELLLVAAVEVDEDTMKRVATAARKTFSIVTTIKPKLSVETGWPGACNHLFRTAATYANGLRRYFLWFEPDAIWLRRGGLDTIETAYLASDKPFMGNVYHNPIDHLPGNAVYPEDIKRWNPYILQPIKKGLRELAWDCIRPELTIKYAANSPLFQHEWGDFKTNTAPTFKDSKSLSILRDDAVLFHRCKDHTLILRLRERNKAESKKFKLFQKKSAPVIA